MLKISIDEGSAFDLLSICQIKINKSEGPNKVICKNNFDILKNEIVSQISPVKFKKIVGSLEYRNLLKANKHTFNVVDKAKYDKVLASEVDKKNYQRYLCKTKLQSRFFNTKITEIKIGYRKD